MSFCTTPRWRLTNQLTSQDSDEPTNRSIWLLTNQQDGGQLANPQWPTTKPEINFCLLCNYCAIYFFKIYNSLSETKRFTLRLFLLPSFKPEVADRIRFWKFFVLNYFLVKFFFLSLFLFLKKKPLLIWYWKCIFSWTRKIFTDLKIRKTFNWHWKIESLKIVMKVVWNFLI